MLVPALCAAVYHLIAAVMLCRSLRFMTFTSICYVIGLFIPFLGLLVLVNLSRYTRQLLNRHSIMLGFLGFERA